MLRPLVQKLTASKNKRLVRVVAVVAGISLLSIAGIGGYAVAQNQARSSLVEANERARVSLQQFEATSTALDENIKSAQATLDASNGKTSDEVSRKALASEIQKARTWLQAAIRESRVLATSVGQSDVTQDLLFWPPAVNESAAQISQAAATLNTGAAAVRKQLSVRVADVAKAQALWQAEQDRLAAEAAAEAARAQAERLSKPKQISSESSLSPTGGATAPSAPPPPDVPAPVEEGFDIDGYLGGLLASGNYGVQYVTGLCSGYYICGRTLVGGGGNPIIQLDDDPAVLEIYSTDAGKYVLVHEAAHVRQFWFYGTVALMISESEKFVDYPGAAAVEYMADCATIWKIGYALGGTSYPYTSSCTPDQYAEGSRIW
jgi:hypothetical protein